MSVAFVPGPTYKCSETGCRFTADPSRLLEEDQRPAVKVSPIAEARFRAYVARPIIRSAIGIGSLIEGVPFALLLCSVGLALRRLGARMGDPLADAVPWLRRASQAAVASAFAIPVGNAVTKGVLSHGTPEGLVIPLDVNAFGIALMLAGAAYASVWALEAGLRAQRDLAEIV